MMCYFKPANHAFKTWIVLSKWQQHGSVTIFLASFSDKYTDSHDVDANEALFRFLDGL